MRVNNNLVHDIYNDSLELVLTTSLKEFLSIFLQGDVFDKGGLYEWHETCEVSNY
jgi:hypothetical protein